MQLDCDKEVLKWNFDSEVIIQKKVEDLFYAYYDPYSDLIIAESGKNLIASEKLAFKKNGFQFYRHKINHSLTWIYENKEYTIDHLGLNQVLVLSKINKIFLLINSQKENKIVVLNMDSSIVCNIHPFQSEKFKYFEQTKEDVLVITESNNFDGYGRNQFNYSINLETFQLKKRV